MSVEVRFLYWREEKHGWRDGHVVSMRTKTDAARDHIQSLGLGLAVATETGKQPGWVGTNGGATGWKSITDEELIGFAMGLKVIDVPSGKIKDEIDEYTKNQYIDRTEQEG